MALHDFSMRYDGIENENARKRICFGAEMYGRGKIWNGKCPEAERDR
jgi:hypothetical protein